MDRAGADRRADVDTGTRTAVDAAPLPAPTLREPTTAAEAGAARTQGRVAGGARVGRLLPLEPSAPRRFPGRVHRDDPPDAQARPGGNIPNEIARRLTSGDSGDVGQLGVAEEASDDLR